ncbi:hypothetical protein DFP73DRAFT_561873 [Morchella snyderi]|nr:hypothetical protein DFP73DRAFT_561873 [Morchella snyderi]
MKMSNNDTHYYNFQPRHYQPGEPGYIDLSSRPGPSSASSVRSGSSQRSTASYHTHPSSASSRRSSQYNNPPTQHYTTTAPRRTSYPESVHSGYASSIGSYASGGYCGPSLSPDGRDRWVPPQAPSVGGSSTAGRGGGGARSEYSGVASRTTTDVGAPSRRSSLLSGGSARDSAYGSGGGSVSSRAASLTSSNLRRVNTHTTPSSPSSSKYTEGRVWPTNSINWVVDPTRRAGERR